MNYEPNTEHWRRGDIVIHDADAKEPKMLMRIVGFTRDGLAKCQYVSRARGRKIYPNDLRILHAPSRFGISEKIGELAQEYLDAAQEEWERVRRWNTLHRENPVGIRVRTTSADGGFEAVTTTPAWFRYNSAYIHLNPGGGWLLKFVESIP